MVHTIVFSFNEPVCTVGLKDVQGTNKSQWADLLIDVFRTAI